MVTLGDNTVYKEGQSLWCVGRNYGAKEWRPIERVPLALEETMAIVGGLVFRFSLIPNIVIMLWETPTDCYSTENSCQIYCDFLNSRC